MAQLAWFDTDGTTPIGSVFLGKVGPGQTYLGLNGAYRQVVLKNIGATSATDVAIEIRKVSSFDLNEFALIALGATTPDPGDFVDFEDPNLVIGTIAADAEVKVWVNVDVPLAAVRGKGQYASLRASGAETA